MPKKTDMITWIIERKNILNEKVNKGKRYKERKDADLCLKHCPKCNRIYENIKFYHRKGYDQYYENFPKYGKDKKICMKCKEENITWVSPHDPGDENE